MAGASLDMSAKLQDVAIIGMSCLYPKAPNLAAFWQNILAGVDAIGEPPEGTVAPEIYDPESDANDRLYTVKGGYVGDLITFDPTKFGVIPRSIDGGEPEHFVALQLAHDALEDAGYLRRPIDKERTEIILGRGTYANRGFVTVLQHTFALDQLIHILSQLHPEHSPADLAELKARLKQSLPPFNAETAASLPHSVMCGRIANRLDIMGPAYTVDAACASALIAADLGMRDLSSGACDLALVGAVQVSTTYPIAILFSQLGALSRSGRIRPFHSESDGTLLGEGAGVLVLKRLADAEADGDRVYAVIKGIGTSSDGRAMGLLAPRVEGEELAMRRAYANSGIAPDSIGLVEAHGTATPIGDQTELTALQLVFGDGTNGRPRCPLGAVKSMIGHAIPAAGAAGLIKTALAVYHRVIPPTLHAESPNPALASTPFYLPAEARPWIHGAEHRRRAAVSAFGFGGINGHAILEEYRPAENVGPTDWRRRSLARRWDSEVVAIDGDGPAEVADRCRGVIGFLDGNPELELRDLAYTVNTARRPEAAASLAVVAKDPADLRAKLEFAAAKLADPGLWRIRERSGVYFFSRPLGREGKLALLFPGEGSQYPGMLSDLCIHFPEARDWFDLMDRAFRDHDRGVLPSQSIFPIPGSPESEQQRLWQMDGAIEAVFAADQAMHSVLSSIGVRPDMIVGHSTGEYSALLASGAARVEDRDHLIHHILEGNQATERAQARGLVPDGVLLAVGPADPEVIAALSIQAESDVFLAMDNCPHQAVLWGSAEAIARIEQQLRRQGAVCQKLPFSRAYHTPLFAPVCDELEGFYSNATFSIPEIPLYSCVTAARVPDDPDAIRQLAIAHWARPVRFRETVETLYEDGARIFVEVGPAANLTAFVADILRQKDHLAVSSNNRRRSGLEQLNHLIALLAAHGVSLDLASLYERRSAVELDQEAVFAGRQTSKTDGGRLKLSLTLPEMKLSADMAPWTTGRAPVAVPAATPAAFGVAVAAAPVGFGGALEAAPVAVAQPFTTTPTSARTQVMSAYLGVMEHFLDSQEQILSSLMAAPRPAMAPVTNASWPLANARIQTDATGRVTVHCRLDVEREAFLLDHTLGGTVSADPRLRALPVFPLAMSLEMMAQAARLVRPERRLVEIRNLRVQRWLPFERSSVDVVLTAAPTAVEREIEVRLSVSEPSSASDVQPTVSGIFVLASESALPPPAPPFALTRPRPSRWSPAELYSEGLSHGMFHGPTLRGVASLDSVGDDGIEATLRVADPDALVRGPGRFENLVCPLLIDAVSQLVGYWTAETFARDFVVFPTGFERLHLYAAAAAATCPPRVRGRARCEGVGEQRVRAELEVVGDDGALVAAISGWEVTRAPLPERVYAFRLAPSEAMMSDSLESRALADRGLAACRLELPESFLVMEEGIWLRSLAFLALGPAERRRWLELDDNQAERRSWFLRTMAAKDAIRLHLHQRRGVRVYPADVELVGRVDRTAHAIAQRGGITVAAAGEVGPGGALGIAFHRTGEPLSSAGWTAAELRHLEGLSEALQSEWTARIVCARRAAAQALASTGNGREHAVDVSGIDEDEETVRISADGVHIDVATTRDKGIVVAIATWEGRR
jgi:acyl transferase domain-containing protein